MRFETSQTTPPHLDRRLQRRMLSFVALLSVIMFTLSAVKSRSASNDADSKTRLAASPDALNFEVRREVRDLKEGEFVIPESEENGPRGQSPRSLTPVRGERERVDRELFTSRRQEQANREEGREETLFPNRKNTLSNSLRDPYETSSSSSSSNLRSSGNSRSADGGMVVPARPTKRPGTLQSNPDSLDEDWSSAPVAIDRRDTSRNHVTGNSSSRGRVVSPESIDFTQDFTETDRSGRNGRYSSIRDVSATDVDDLRDTVPIRRRPSGGIAQGTSEGSLNSNRLGVFAGETLEPPIDLRRRDVNTRTIASSSTPPPYAEVARPEINKRYLDVVKDNTVGVRRDESEVFYWLLDHARRVPTATIEQAAEREVQYINLMTEPDRYRGEPITIEGDLWRLYEFTARPNAYGVTKLYEGWVFTGDSSHHPYRIVCTSLPTGIEPGENLRKPVRITGYFFKREGYRSNGGVHVAPTLLARRISINPMPNGIPQTAGILPYMVGTIMAVGMALLVTIVGFAIGDQRSSRAGMLRMNQQPQVSLAGLQVPPMMSVEESLRQLAAAEQNSAVNGAYGPLVSRESAREHAVHDLGTSHRLISDISNRQHRQQTDVLQSWSARQQVVQAEIDAMRQAQIRGKTTPVSAPDELDSHQLDPANHLLQPFAVPQPVAAATHARTSTTPAKHSANNSTHKGKPLNSPVSPAAVPAAVSAVAPAAVSAVAPAVVSAKVPAVVPAPCPAVGSSMGNLTAPPMAIPTAPSNASTVPPTVATSGTSQLSEWEDEIARLTGPPGKTLS